MIMMMLMLGINDVLVGLNIMMNVSLCLVGGNSRGWLVTGMGFILGIVTGGKEIFLASFLNGIGRIGCSLLRTCLECLVFIIDFVLRKWLFTTVPIPHMLESRQMQVVMDISFPYPYYH